MNETTDTSIDRLIADALQRQQLVKDLDRLIVNDVRRRARRAWMRRWGRAVAFCFGLPMVVVLWMGCTYLFIKHHGVNGFTLSIALWPTLALAASYVYALTTFSPGEV